MKQPEVGSPDDRLRADVVTAAQLYHALRARLPLIFGIAFLAAIAAAVIVFMITPRFTSEAQLLLESRESVYTRALGERELPGGVFDEQAVASQVQVISSRDVAREVIRRLGLVGNPEFDPLMGPIDPITRVKMMLGASQGIFGGAEEERIFDAYYKRLTVFPVARSRVVAIRFASADPELAARAANTIAQVYLEQLEEAKTDMARAASTWLGTSIGDLRDRVSTAEAAVEEFRARSGLLVGGNNATITSQQLGDINTELAQARSAQADAQARARLISDMIAGGRAFEIPDVANNETIVRLLEQRVNLRSQMALEQRTLLPQHPRILELRAQLVDLDAEIAAAAERTVRILENDARLAGARVESLEAALEAQMRVVAQANENEVRLRAMEREARAEREQLETYLLRYREAVARGAHSASLPDARIVSRAVAAQEPSFPRKVPMIMLAAFAAIFLSAGFVVVRELVFGPVQASEFELVSAAPFPTGGGSGGAPAPVARRAPHGSWLARIRGGRFRRAAAAEAEPAREVVAEEVVAEEVVAEEKAVREKVVREAVSDGRISPERIAAQVAPRSIASVSYQMATQPGMLRGTLDASAETPVVADVVAEAEHVEAQVPVVATAHAAAPATVVAAEPLIPEPEITEPEITESEIPEPVISEGSVRADAPVIAETPSDAVEIAEEEEASAFVGKSEPAPRSGADAEEADAEEIEVKPEATMLATMPATTRDEGSEDELSQSEEGAYRFEALIARVAQTPIMERGRRVLVTGLGDPVGLAAFALQFARSVARESQAILVATQRGDEGEDAIGLTDLIAENASFFHVIQGDDDAPLHRVAVGSADPGLLVEEPQALEISVAAFDQAYEWVILSMPDPSDAPVYKLLAGLVDTVIVASDQEPTGPAVIALYDAAKRAGATQVVVACVGDVAKAAAAA